MIIQIKNFCDQLFKKDIKRINIPEEIVISLRNNGLSDLEALEKSDALAKKVKRYIKKEIGDYNNQGVTPRYNFDETNDDILIRIDLFVEPTAEKSVRTVTKLKEQIYEIIKKISWQEFEKVCKLVIEINNCYDCRVTRNTKDGGIDVYGWLRQSNISKRIFRDVNFRIIGQGKHSEGNSKVNNNKVSEFVTDIEKLRKKQGFSLFTLPPEFIDSPAPLIPIFITNGSYGNETILTAENGGIILWNGIQISEDLARYFYSKEFFTNDKIDEGQFKAYLK